MIVKAIGLQLPPGTPVIGTILVQVASRDSAMTDDLRRPLAKLPTTDTTPGGHDVEIVHLSYSPVYELHRSDGLSIGLRLDGSTPTPSNCRAQSVRFKRPPTPARHCPRITVWTPCPLYKIFATNDCVNGSGAKTSSRRPPDPTATRSLSEKAWRTASRLPFAATACGFRVDRL